MAEYGEGIFHTRREARAAGVHSLRQGGKVGDLSRGLPFARLTVQGGNVT